MEHVEILGRVYPINQTIDQTRLIRRSQARSLGSSRARLTVFGKIYEESFRRRRSTDVVGKQRNSFDVATSTMQRGSEKHLCFPLRGRAKPFFFCVHLYLPYLLFPRFQVFLRSIEFFSISIRFFPLCLYILFFPFLFLSFFLSFFHFLFLVLFPFLSPITFSFRSEFRARQGPERREFRAVYTQDLFLVSLGLSRDKC